MMKYKVGDIVVVNSSLSWRNLVCRVKLVIGASEYVVEPLDPAKVEDPHLRYIEEGTHWAQEGDIIGYHQDPNQLPDELFTL